MRGLMDSIEFTHNRGARTRASFDLAPAPESNVQDTVRAAIGRIRQFRVVEGDSTQILLKRRINWATWGESVQLSWYPVSGALHVDVVIRPSLPTTINDWGQGRRDVTAIHQALLAEAQRGG